MHELLAEDYVQQPFHSQELLVAHWGESWGILNPLGRVKRILVHRPGPEVLALAAACYEPDAGALILRDGNGRIRSYCVGERPPDLATMRAQHDALTTVLSACGIDVVELCGGGSGGGDWAGLNQIFTRDLGMVIPGGVILSRFALWMRYGESRLMQAALARIGMPILGAIQGSGVAEGGSFALLDAETAVVGKSVRVNDAGIEQLRHFLSWSGIHLVVVDLPSHRIHLDEAFILLDWDKALVDETVLPHWFLEELRARGMRLIATHPDDPPLTTNCLMVAPGKVVFPATGVRTMERLVTAGIDVVSVDVSEINKMGGGIHCATLELVREEDGD